MGEQGLEEKHRRAKVARGKAKERMERKEKIARIRMRKNKKGKVTRRTIAKKCQVNLKKRQRRSPVRCRPMPAQWQQLPRQHQLNPRQLTQQRLRRVEPFFFFL